MGGGGGYGPAVDAMTCKICLTEPMTHTMIPCGHFCLCETCVNALASVDRYLWKCPICNTKVIQYMRTYM